MIDVEPKTSTKESPDPLGGYFDLNMSHKSGWELCSCSQSLSTHKGRSTPLVCPTKAQTQTGLRLPPYCSRHEPGGTALPSAQNAQLPACSAPSMPSAQHAQCPTCILQPQQSWNKLMEGKKIIYALHFLLFPKFYIKCLYFKGRQIVRYFHISILLVNQETKTYHTSFLF